MIFLASPSKALTLPKLAGTDIGAGPVFTDSWGSSGGGSSGGVSHHKHHGGGASGGGFLHHGSGGGSSGGGSIGGSLWGVQRISGASHKESA